MKMQQSFIYSLDAFPDYPDGCTAAGCQRYTYRAADAFRREGGVKITFSVRAPEGNTNGSIRLKGDKFLLETEGVTTWFDGRTQWSYLASSDEVNVSEPTPERVA